MVDSKLGSTWLGAEGCVSFDVTNLFTQVPVDEALKVLEEWLSANNTLMERTSTNLVNSSKYTDCP